MAEVKPPIPDTLTFIRGTGKGRVEICVSTYKYVQDITDEQMQTRMLVDTQVHQISTEKAIQLAGDLLTHALAERGRGALSYDATDDSVGPSRTG